MYIPFYIRNAWLPGCGTETGLINSIARRYLVKGGAPIRFTGGQDSTGDNGSVAGLFLLVYLMATDAGSSGQAIDCTAAITLAFSTETCGEVENSPKQKKATSRERRDGHVALKLAGPERRPPTSTNKPAREEIQT